jgi:hypothetical protein
MATQLGSAHNRNQVTNGSFKGDPRQVLPSKGL